MHIYVLGLNVLTETSDMTTPHHDSLFNLETLQIDRPTISVRFMRSSDYVSPTDDIHLYPIYGLEQERRNSSALAMELRLFLH